MRPTGLIRSIAGVLAIAVAGNLGFSANSVVRAAREGGNWPQFRGPQRDGISTETGLLASWPQAGPPITWTATGLGA